MRRRIIIPCGGKATRFGGVRKELLPLSAEPGDTPLRRAALRAIGWGGGMVVSSLEHIAAHTIALDGLPLSYRVSGGDLWGAIRAGMDDSDGGLVLPDTVWSGSVPYNPQAAITFGVFETDEPERFSVLRDNRILTKQPGPPALAWGCVLWSREAAEVMQSRPFTHYDRAFEAAMQLGYSTFPIADYHDLGDWAAYRRYVQHAT